MKIKDVIKQVAIFLGLTNVMNANLDDFDNLDSQTKKDINLILSSINEVLCDIATDYLFLSHKEEIEVSGGSFSFSNLSKTFYKFESIDTEKDYKIDFETLVIEDGTYTIEYQYLPEIYELDDTISGFGRLTIYALCYGVAEEFCLISGNYAESEMWHSKFENAMLVAKKPENIEVRTLKQRRWIWKKLGIQKL